ncbi:MAG: hypothetical protein Q8L48_08885 [Archangium sp.]|nr:hypothetical protein [Archangium sp.]
MSQLSIQLFHGRSDPDEQLEDWGFDGPCLGPLDGVQLTYGKVRLVGPFDELVSLGGVDDLLFYDGQYFGDARISTVDEQPATAQVEEQLTLVPPSLCSREQPVIELPPRLAREYLRRVEVFVDSVRELAGDRAAEGVRRALQKVAPRLRSG